MNKVQINFKYVGIFVQLFLVTFISVTTLTAQTSSLDFSFNAVVLKDNMPASVSTLAVQSNGQIIIGGDFTQVSGISRNNIARLNVDGSIDESFNPGIGFNNAVDKVVIQNDGKILVSGSFTGFNNTQRNALARLNSDGSLDTTFDADILGGTVLSIGLQTDGKILIGGSFSAVSRQNRNGFARLNSDGSLDNGFNPILGNPQLELVTVRRILVQPDGKIVVGGTFSGVNSISRNNLIRLNSNGTLDTTFNAGNITAVSLVETYPNGKYLVYSASGLVRLNNDGTTDTSFQIPNLRGIVNAILVQPDGTIILGGNLLPGRLVRLRDNGIIDHFFFPIGANNVIRAIVRQSNGLVLIGGDFTTLANVPRITAARLIIAPIRLPITLFDYDNDGRADLSVFRPSDGFWYELRSLNSDFFSLQFGEASDKLAPADYDGDGETDIAVFRENVFGAGDKAYFYITDSSDDSFHFEQLGTQGDLPIPGDWDGDGIADLAVYRSPIRSGGQSYFYYRPSSQPNVDFRTIPWGTSGDKPVVGDFDGDGKLDAAIFRPSTLSWYILQSSNGQVIQQQFGAASDILTPADYDGDGKTNIAVFRPSTGYWYILMNSGFSSVQFGASGDVPVTADYDGDGRADIAVYRPTNGVWYLQQTTAGFSSIQFGAGEDIPVPSVYTR